MWLSKLVILDLVMNLAGLWDRIASSVLYLECEIVEVTDWRKCDEPYASDVRNWTEE